MCPALCDGPGGPLDDWLSGETWIPAALFVGTFFSEDLTCITAGALIAEGAVGPVAAIVACALGIWVSDLGLYGLGYLAARGLVRWRWLSERLPRSGGRWRTAIERRGATLVFLTRFLPGSRMFCYVAAGAVGFPVRRFAAILAIAVGLWTPLLVGMAWGAGAAVGDLLDRFGRAAWLVVPAVILLGLLALRVAPLFFTRRGRRILGGRWRRLRHWEYWPVAVVYVPVMLELFRQAIVRRRFAVFTACNPGIPLGGLALESKAAILAQLPAEPRDDVRVARTAVLDGAAPFVARLEIVAVFLGDGPCVLKPDTGERGAGVEVIREPAAARSWLERHPGDAVVQEFVAGEEFGVTWQRCPQTGAARVRSVARKVLPEVIGDGRRSLEELILDDRRHAAMAGIHLAQLAERLEDVPAAGERVLLGDLGTHSRGATFLDARHLATEPLRAALERFTATADGLDFGRFDLRAPDATALAAGRGLVVLELNGVTGEPAHVYHPGYPLWRGVADLIDHWRAACARGAANVARGHASAGFGELWRLLVGMRRRRRDRHRWNEQGTATDPAA